MCQASDTFPLIWPDWGRNTPVLRDWYNSASIWSASIGEDASWVSSCVKSFVSNPLRIAIVSLGFCQAYAQHLKDYVSADQFQNVYQNHIIVRQQQNHCLWLTGHTECKSCSFKRRKIQWMSSYFRLQCAVPLPHHWSHQPMFYQIMPLKWLYPLCSLQVISPWLAPRLQPGMVCMMAYSLPFCNMHSKKA